MEMVPSLDPVMRVAVGSGLLQVGLNRAKPGTPSSTHATDTFKVIDGHAVSYRGHRLLLKILIKLRVDGGVLAFLRGGLFRAGRGGQRR